MTRLAKAARFLKVITLTKVILLIHSLRVQASGLLLEVGNGDPSGCDTIGTGFDLFQGSAGVTWEPQIVVGGKSKSKKVIGVNKNPQGCLSKFYAFFQRYSFDLNGANMLMTLERSFSELITIEGSAYYLGEVQAVKFEFQAITLPNTRYAMSLTISRYSDDNYHGNLILFFNMADNTIIAGSQISSMNFKFQARQLHSLLFTNENDVLEYAFIVNYRNLPQNPQTGLVPTFVRYQVKPDGSCSFQTNTFESNTVGMTAAYTEKDFYLFGISPNNANNISDIQYAGIFAYSALAPIYQNMRIVLSSTSNAAEVSPNIESFAAQTTSVADRTQRAYGFGAFYRMGTTQLATRTTPPQWGGDKILVVEVLLTLPASGDCLKMNPFVIDIAHSGFEAPEFNIEILHSLSVGQKMHLSFMLAPQADAPTHIGKQGSRIVRMELPGHFKCNSMSNTVIEVNQQSLSLRGARYDDAFQQADDFRSQISSPLKSYFYGAMCASLDSISPCKIVNAVSNYQWDSGNKFLYMANSATKFVPTNGTNDDGLKVHPTSSDGSMHQTNGGGQSILIGGNAIYGLPLLTVEAPGRYFFIRYLSSSSSTQVSASSFTDPGGQITTANQRSADLATSSYPSTLQGNSFYGLSPQEMNSGMVSSAIGKDILINLASWHSTLGVMCDLTNVNDASTIRMCSMIRFAMVDSMTNYEHKGVYDPVTSSIKFELNIDLAAKRAASLPYYQLVVRHVLASTNFQGSKVIINNGVAWLMPELATSLQFSTAEMTSLQSQTNVLFKMSSGITSWKYLNSANQIVEMTIPADLSAQRVCTAQDSFALVINSLVIEYDGANTLFEQSQSFFVTNSQWTNAVHKVNIGLVQDTSLFGLSTFENSKLKIQLPATASLINTDKSVTFVVMQKECADIYAPNVAQPPLITTFSSNLLSPNPLQSKDITVTLKYSNCQASPLIPRQAHFQLALDWNDNSAIILIEDVATHFSQHAVDSKCVIKEWYISEIGQTIRMANDSLAASKTLQSVRTSALGPLTLDLNRTAGPLQINFQFQVNVLMRATAAQPLASALNPISVTFNVSAGCFHISFLTMNEINTMPHPQVQSFNPITSELVWILPQSLSETSIDLDLSQAVKFITNIPSCGAFKITSFEDSGLQQLTTSSSVSGLKQNPSFVNQTSGELKIELSLKYGGNAKPMPDKVFLRAETSNEKVYEWSVGFMGCPEPERANRPKVVLNIIQTSVIIELNNYFSIIDYGLQFCKERTYELLKADEYQPFNSPFVLLMNQTLIIDRLIEEMTDFRVMYYSLSRSYFVSLDFQIIPPVKTKDIQILLVFLGDMDQLKKVTKVNHKIPCACVSIEYLGKMIKLTLKRSKLTLGDVGVHSIKGLASDETVYSVALTILKLKGDFSAQGMLSYPLLSDMKNQNVEFTKDEKYIRDYSSLSPEDIQNLIITGINLTTPENESLVDEELNSSFVSDQTDSSNQQQNDSIQATITNNSQIDEELNQNSTNNSTMQPIEEVLEEKITLPDPRVDIVIKPLVNPLVPKLSNEKAMKLFVNYQPLPKPSGFEPPKAPQSVRLKISNIDRSGNITIDFNQPLELPSFIKNNQSIESGPNGRNLDVDLQEIDVDRDILEILLEINSNVDPNDIQYSLEITDWTEKNMKLHLNFTNPLMVSKGLIPDVIFAKIKNTHMFQAKHSNERLSADRKYLRYELPTQLPHGLSIEDVVGQAVMIQNGMTAMYFIQIVVQVMMRGSMSMLLSLFFSLQVICYLIIFNVPMPPNLGIFIEELTKLIEFRMMSINNMGATISGNSDFNVINQLTGIENSILNEISSIFGIAVIAIVGILVIGLALLIPKYREWATRILIRIRNRFLFNGLITTFTVAYIKICIAFGKQAKLILSGKQIQTKEQIVGLVFVSIILGYPLISATTILYKRKQLDDEKVKEKISNFYKDIEPKKGNWALAYYLIFLYRRIVFVAIPISLGQIPELQIHFLLLMSSLFFIYYAGSKPHSTRMRNWLEIFNESIIMVINYHMMCFSEWNDSPESKFIIGYSFEAFIVFLVTCNLGLLVVTQIKALYLRRLRRKRQEILRKQEVKTIESLDEGAKLQQKLLKKVNTKKRKFRSQIIKTNRKLPVRGKSNRHLDKLFDQPRKSDIIVRVEEEQQMKSEVPRQTQDLGPPSLQPKDRLLKRSKKGRKKKGKSKVKKDI